MAKTDLSALRHDLRGRVHTAILNLEAAQTLAAKWEGANAQRLYKHLDIIADELKKMEKLVAEVIKQMK